MHKDERWRRREISEWVDKMARGEMIRWMIGWISGRMDGWGHGSQANVDDKMPHRHVEIPKERQRDKSMTKKAQSQD